MSRISSVAAFFCRNSAPPSASANALSSSSRLGSGDAFASSRSLLISPSPDADAFRTASACTISASIALRRCSQFSLSKSRLCRLVVTIAIVRSFSSACVMAPFACATIGTQAGSARTRPISCKGVGWPAAAGAAVAAAAGAGDAAAASVANARTIGKSISMDGTPRSTGRGLPSRPQGILAPHRRTTAPDASGHRDRRGRPVRERGGVRVARRPGRGRAQERRIWLGSAPARADARRRRRLVRGGRRRRARGAPSGDRQAGAAAAGRAAGPALARPRPRRHPERVDGRRDRGSRRGGCATRPSDGPGRRVRCDRLGRDSRRRRRRVRRGARGRRRSTSSCGRTSRARSERRVRSMRCSRRSARSRRRA